jgi:hypothetical protein
VPDGIVPAAGRQRGLGRVVEHGQPLPSTCALKLARDVPEVPIGGLHRLEEVDCLIPALGVQRVETVGVQVFELGRVAVRYLPCLVAISGAGILGTARHAGILDMRPLGAARDAGVTALGTRACADHRRRVGPVKQDPVGRAHGEHRGSPFQRLAQRHPDRPPGPSYAPFDRRLVRQFLVKRAAELQGSAVSDPVLHRDHGRHRAAEQCPGHAGEPVQHPRAPGLARVQHDQAQRSLVPQHVREVAGAEQVDAVAVLVGE